MLDILKEIQGRLSKPFSIMPNAGYPRDIDGRQMKDKIAGIQVSPPFGNIDTALEVIA